MESVENTISQPLDFKIFLGKMPQTPNPNPALQNPPEHRNRILLYRE